MLVLKMISWKHKIMICTIVGIVLYVLASYFISIII